MSSAYHNLQHLRVVITNHLHISLVTTEDSKYNDEPQHMLDPSILGKVWNTCVLNINISSLREGVCAKCEEKMEAVSKKETLKSTAI
ncbi:hypothetical protein DPMN_131953 [Dreissena polymorpha]|uniref:Uncharacterized protein n=1 Tax=Dreissena polymorpha TaxID=45954 RepID=A0A9D4FXE1_DREPO|nr:hypothetical protein DPMN_131953 [Dreissena polymorpha]